MEDTKKKIEEFVKAKVKGSKLSVPMMPIDWFGEQLKNFGFIMDEEWDTNGWEIDFWIEFNSDSAQIKLSGSWYSGNYKLTYK